MSHFMGSHNDAAEAAGVLDDGHAVHLLQSLVHHACAADVSKAFFNSERKHTTEIRQLVGYIFFFIFHSLVQQEVDNFCKSPSRCCSY